MQSLLCVRSRKSSSRMTRPSKWQSLPYQCHAVLTRRKAIRVADLIPRRRTRTIHENVLGARGHPVSIIVLRSNLPGTMARTW